MAIHGLDPNSAGMLGMSVLMGCRGIGALLGPFIASTWTGFAVTLDPDTGEVLSRTFGQ